MAVICTLLVSSGYSNQIRSYESAVGKQRRKQREQKIARQSTGSAWRSTLSNGKLESVRAGRAAPHKELTNKFVHVFVDDQNLFWGIVNESGDITFRIDFGELKAGRRLSNN